MGAGDLHQFAGDLLATYWDYLSAHSNTGTGIRLPKANTVFEAYRYRDCDWAGGTGILCN